MDAKIVVGGGNPFQPDTFSIKKIPPLFFLLLDLLVPEPVSMEEFKGTTFQSFHKFLLIKTARARRPPHTLHDQTISIIQLAEGS